MGSSDLAVRLTRHKTVLISRHPARHLSSNTRHPLIGKMLSPLMPQQMFPPQYLDSNGYPIAYAHPGPPLASMSSMSLHNLTMKAVGVHRFGGPDVLQVDTNVPVPEVGDDQVLVRVIYAGVNPVETYIREGQYSRLPELPYTPGSDAAGYVQQLGRNVTTLKVGDRVFVSGNSSTSSNSGSYSQYVMIVGCRGAVNINPRHLMLPEASIRGVALGSSTPPEWAEMGAAIVAGIEAGWVSPVINKEYTMDQVAQVHHDIVHSKGAKGKLVLRVADE